MFVLALFLIAAAVGEDCSSNTTEATCSGGCIWTNYTGVCVGGACGGTPTCAGLAETGAGSCGSTTGCTWVPISPESCTGTPTCSGQADQDTCETLLGCSWIPAGIATCAGHPTTCSGDNETNCALTGCTYTSTATPAACTGHSSVNCYNAINADSCAAIDYCYWKEPTHPQCFVKADEGMTCDFFNVVEEVGVMGPVWCSWMPGCTYTGIVGTCTGDISSTCSDLNEFDCEIAGCSSEYAGECKASYSCDNYNFNEEQCNTTAGCTFDNNTETCTGTPTSCSLYNNKEEECYGHAGCYFNYAYECALPSGCYDLYETGCVAAGCNWDAEKFECTGTVTIAAATCSALSGNSTMECQSAGCESKYLELCTGSVKLSSCAEWGYGGPTCTSLGCTSSTVDYTGTCEGSINFNAGASTTNDTECTALGPAFYWYGGDEGGCEQNSKNPTFKQCSDFTSDGNEICYGLECTWQAAVPEGCAGTPTDAGTECASFAADQDKCTGNQCTWVPAGVSMCTGSTTGVCSGRSAGNCANISGCTYTAPVDTAICTGTPPGFCIGGTSTLCGNVHGCVWTGCSSRNSQSNCAAGGGCTWNQPGMCADPEPEPEPEPEPGQESESDRSYTIAIPALLGLLLIVLLI